MEEIKMIVNTVKVDRSKLKHYEESDSHGYVPFSIDWLDKGAVTPI